jgi:3-oxoacyl-[acyl-carrier-protein] synthase-3
VSAGRAELLGVGGYLPAAILGNAELEARLDKPRGWIRGLLGIERRHLAAPGELGYHLGARAAAAALADSGIGADEIDLLLYHTNWADYSIPGSGVLVARELGLRPGTPALDHREQCAGFLYGLMAADAYLRTGAYRRVLVVCGEKLVSNSLPYAPIAPIFGDAGAAVVLGPAGGGAGLIDVRCYSDGAGVEFGIVSSDHYDALDPARRAPAELERAVESWRAAPLQRRLAYHWDGGVIYKNAVSRMVEATRELLHDHRLDVTEVDWYLFHQANLGIVERAGKLLRLPEERVLTNLAPYGNTSSASIPLLLADGLSDGRIRPGQLLLMCAFAVGYVWAAALYRT